MDDRPFDAASRAVPDRTRCVGAKPKTIFSPAVIRGLLILNVAVLVVVRLIRDADDFSDWDLIPFLNANAFESLWQLLQRPELHFRTPFSVTMNVGSESVPSTILLRIFGHISLYWSPVLVLFVYDTVFFLLVFLFFSAVFADAFSECVAWALIAMSSIILTYAATSAFNMQGYVAILLGLLGCEYVLQKRAIVGTAALTAAFGVMPQGYPLGLFLPYYAISWIALRTVMGQRGFGRLPQPSDPRLPTALWRAARCILLVAVLVAIVQYLSNNTYVGMISSLVPSGPSASVPPGQWWKLGERIVLFVRQSFVPVYRVDDVPVGFAPYLVYVAVFGVALLVLCRRIVRSPKPVPRLRRARRLGGALVTIFAVATVIAGYIPAFLSQPVKSQRAVFGDFFLITLSAHWIASTRERSHVRSRTIACILASVLFASDAYYLHFTASVSHAMNHSPVFDFDLADGLARHDIATAIGMMREQVVNEHAALVVYYPQCYQENTTDPALFFARFLRHFGRYRGRRDVIFPCRWCEVKYGCPFPAVIDRPCRSTCCYNDPLSEIRSQRLGGKRVFLWWWREPRAVRVVGGWDAHNEQLASDAPTRLLRRLERRYAMTPIELPPQIGRENPPQPGSWVCYELSEK
jgi:hypothetical protein